MCSPPLLFFTSAVLAASNAAASAAFTATRNISAKSEDVSQPDLVTFEQRMQGVHRYGKASALPRTALVIVSLAAVLAIIFLALQCFRAQISHKNVDWRTRRLAVGGEDDDSDNKDPCQVRREVAGPGSISHAHLFSFILSCVLVMLALLRSLSWRYTILSERSSARIDYTM